jgi:mannose-6-phosphate isomerase-like protein (cupin superfamily)
MTSQSASRLDLRSRVVRRSDYVPCDEAFIDTRLPGREGKLNYCIIGPGVAENAKQVVNIVEPHGFNVGGVSLPTGKINSLHSHTTAEVFIVMRGDWRFFWGYDGTDGEAVLSPGDVITVPTGTFRAFESVGSDDNFMLSFLGEDDPGHVTWANDVIEGAAEYGFYLRKDSSLVDTRGGDPMPQAEELLHPLGEEQLLKFNRTSPGEMLARVYNVARNPGLTGVFRDETLPGGAKQYHAIIGEGCHELGEHKSHVLNPHSFSLGALVAGPGNGWLRHRYGVKQVLLVGSGSWEVTMGESGAEESFAVGAEDTISIPAGVWRAVRNTGSDEGVLYVASSGDLKVEITWAREVAAQL